MPVLIKFIDAMKDLSVQVHPYDDYARKYEGDNGKSEMWYVIDAEPGAELIFGFEHPVTKEILKEAVANGTLDKHLHKIKIQKGDVIYVPAGTVHGIGAGALIAEIQESSNVTYRVYDYNRTDKNGNKRELHFDKAVEVMNMDTVKESGEKRLVHYYPGSSREIICRSQYFETEKIEVNKACSFSVMDESFQVLLCISGEGQVGYFNDENKPVRFKKGDCLFIPAGTGRCTLLGDAEVLKVIILTDYVSNEDLVRLYNLADGFVYPSFYEGFGIPPLEAMACGTPVAVANATSLPEVVGDAGMYFDPFSEEEITNSIVKLLDEDKAIRDEKRIERVNCFNWQDSANAMFSKYIEVVEFASGCCILMNKNVIEKVGMLDESYFMYYEDTDFCARLKKETIDIVYVPTAKIWHKVGASSSGEYSKFTAYYMAKNRLKFISKYSHNNLQRAYLRTIASGIKGYILNRNSKVSIKALKDFIKEQRT